MRNVLVLDYRTKFLCFTSMHLVCFVYWDMPVRDPVKSSVSDVFPYNIHQLTSSCQLQGKEHAAEEHNLLLLLSLSRLRLVPRPGEGTNDWCWRQSVHGCYLAQVMKTKFFSEEKQFCSKSTVLLHVYLPPITVWWFGSVGGKKVSVW